MFANEQRVTLNYNFPSCDVRAPPLFSIGNEGEGSEGSLRRVFFFFLGCRRCWLHLYRGRVYSGSFPSLDATFSHLLSLLPRLSLSTASPIIQAKEKKSPACISALCLEFPYAVEPWQRAFPGGGRGSPSSVRSKGQRWSEVLHKQLLVFLREAPASPNRIKVVFVSENPMMHLKRTATHVRHPGACGRSFQLGGEK